MIYDHIEIEIDTEPFQSKRRKKNIIKALKQYKDPLLKNIQAVVYDMSLSDISNEYDYIGTEILAELNTDHIDSRSYVLRKPYRSTIYIKGIRDIFMFEDDKMYHNQPYDDSISYDEYIKSMYMVDLPDRDSIDPDFIDKEITKYLYNSYTKNNTNKS